MRLALIDGSNLYKSAGALNIRIDYKRLLNLLNEDESLLRACYFTALRDKEIITPVRKTVDWLAHNGYSVVSKPTQEFIGTDGRVHIKGNVDVDIAVYAFKYAAKVKEIYLFSGDGDFTVLVKELQETYALKVYVVSSMGLVSTELRKQCDKFICLSEIKEDIERVS